MIRKLLIICLVVELMACASAPSNIDGDMQGKDYLAGVESRKYSGAVFGNQPQEDDSQKKEQFEVYPGTGEFIDMEAAQKVKEVISEDGEFTFNFEGNELTMVVNLILGEILKENYVIAPGVSGKVTFATVKPVNKEQVMPILEMLLSWNNAALVYLEGRYHVMPKAQAIKGNLLPRYGNIDKRSGYTVMVVPLEYVAPMEMEKILTPYVKEGAIVKADNARNLLFLSGTRRELQMYLDTINIFDVDWLAGMSTGIFTLNRVESTQVVTELETIFGEGADNPLAGMFRFMPLERLNAIMVITPQEKYLHKAKEWILRLDRADSESSMNLYVYNVKNIKADDLASYLMDVFGGGGGRSSKKSNTGQVVPGQTGQEIGSTTNKSASIKRSSNNDNGINITPVEENNQILINANAQEYEAIMAAISRLDIEPLQVFIEAKIIEVNLDDEISHGIDWIFGAVADDGGGDDGGGDDGGEDDGTGESITSLNKFAGLRDTESATLSGGNLLYKLTGVDVSATINALQTSGNGTVLSSPTLLVLNNKEASINVGDQIPIRTNNFGGGFDSGNGSVFRSSVQYRQTGIKLQVKPRINPGGLVYLELTQEVSNPDVADENGNRPINNRDLTTEVAIQSGETVVMGGLITQEESRSNNGVPFVSKIPVVGNLFGSKSKISKRTELMILLTPTVIENAEQAEKLTREYSEQFKGLKPFNKSQINNAQDDE